MGWTGTYRGGVRVVVARWCASYQRRVLSCLLSRADSDRTLADSDRTPTDTLRKVSHRILPEYARVSSLYVWTFMREAAPRSHFCGYPPVESTETILKLSIS